MNEDGLIERWNALTEARAAFLEVLEKLGEDRVSKAPSDGGWSALQVMEHIMSSETGTLGYLKKKTSSGWESLDLAGPEHVQAGEELVKRLQSAERYKAPSVLPEPAGSASVTTLIASWDQLRDDMEQFVFSLEEEFFPRLVFRQPAAGPLNLFHTLEFLAAHIHHHLPQLRRIQADLEK
ncbi:MAG: DinB family protein [Flavobacteriales bacterium]|jgi:hypothetical protein